MQIESGKKMPAVRAVIYGPEGIGKSTMASFWPKPLFLDIEGGTHHLDVARITAPKSWSAVQQIFAELERNSQGYKTLVIDTADWLEKLVKDAICVEHKVVSLGDVAYGQLYAKLGGYWGRMLDSLSRIADGGMNVILLAHSQLAHCEIPEETGSFDRYELKLNNSFKVSTSAMTKEWASVILFMNYETFVVETDGKTKARGGSRVIHTTHSVCWDAKNRYDLPAKIKVANNYTLPPELAVLLVGVPESAPQSAPVAPASIPAPMPPATPVAPPAAPVEPPRAVQPPMPPPVAPIAPAAHVEHVTPPAPPAPPAPSVVIEPEKQRLLDQLKELMIMSGVTFEELDEELSRAQVVPKGMNPRNYNIQTLSRVVTKWEAVSNNIAITRNTNKKENQK